MFIHKHFPTELAFRAYLATLERPRFVTKIVIHHTYIPTVTQWKGMPTLNGVRDYYINQLGWDRGPHFFVAPDGIYQMSPPTEEGIHANEANAFSLGIEVVGNYDSIFWQEPVREFALGTIRALLDWLGLDPSCIEGHRTYNPEKSCPGWAVDIEQVRNLVRNQKRTEVYVCYKSTPIYEGPEATFPIAIGGTAVLEAGAVFETSTRMPNGWLHLDTGVGFVPDSCVKYTYNVKSPLFFACVDSPGRIAHIIKPRHRKEYTYVELEYIINEYRIAGEKTGVDWRIAVSQMIHETSWLNSWWSARPRRNPAGLGVTGASSTEKPAALDWQQQSDNRWVQGHAFPTWEYAVKAHVGHLIVYAIPEDRWTEDQKAYVQHSPRRSFVKNPGTCQTIGSLAGTWAADSRYAHSLVQLVNDLR